VPEFAVARIQRPVRGVAQVGCGNGAKGTDSRQRSRFRAAQGVVVIAVMDMFSVPPARQAHVIHEDVTGIYALAFARVGAATAAPAQIT
jgi:hypothetical protein